MYNASIQIMSFTYILIKLLIIKLIIKSNYTTQLSFTRVPNGLFEHYLTWFVAVR